MAWRISSLTFIFFLAAIVRSFFASVGVTRTRNISLAVSTRWGSICGLFAIVGYNNGEQYTAGGYLLTPPSFALVASDVTSWQHAAS